MQQQPVMEQKNSLQLIQMLRGIACLLVVLLHLTGNCNTIFNTSLFGNAFNFGGSGVDIFFVLSGFIIAYSNQQNAGVIKSLPKFLKKRFIRIYPIYWIVITGFLLLQLALPGFYKSPFLLTGANVASTYFLLPDHVMINGVSWSLTNEFFFYIIFTAALIIPNKKIVLWLYVSYFICLIIISVTGYNRSASPVWYNLFTNPMNIEFLLGILVVLLMRKMPETFVWPLLVVGCLWFTVGAYLNSNNISVVNLNYHSSLNRVILFGVPAFLIILALVKCELTKRHVKVKKVFLILGDASYSIYLIHLPLVAAFYKVLYKFAIINNAMLSILSVIFFGVVCWLGILVFNYVEKPVIKWLNRL